MLKRHFKRAAIVFSLAAVLFLASFAPVQAETGTSWDPLVDRLVADGFDREYLEALFQREGIIFSPKIMARKMNALLRTKLSTAKPGPPKKPEAMGRYLNPILIAGAYAFYRENSGEFARIEEQYKVPGEVLTALLLVETKLGTQVGKHKGVTILASMALGQDFELIKDHVKHQDLSDDMMQWLVKRTQQKGSWGYTELKSLLKYARKNGLDPAIIPSSMYGAIGQCQFIPSSALHYGVDGSGDGKINLFDTTDALYSMANFVRKHGWKADLDRDAELKVIYRYNHSMSYAMTIMAVADKLRKTNEFFGN